MSSKTFLIKDKRSMSLTIFFCCKVKTNLTSLIVCKLQNKLVGGFELLIRLVERLLWSILCWTCTKSECQKMRLYATTPAPPPRKWKFGNFKLSWKFGVKLDFTNQSAILHPPPPKAKKWNFYVKSDFRNQRATLPLHFDETLHTCCTFATR